MYRRGYGEVGECSEISLIGLDCADKFRYRWSEACASESANRNSHLPSDPTLRGERWRDGLEVPETEPGCVGPWPSSRWMESIWLTRQMVSAAVYPSDPATNTLPFITRSVKPFPRQSIKCFFVVPLRVLLSLNLLIASEYEK
uniref:Uncharacterized protein n=1 Tax=Setaria digitata TaxID=48799 RepID=A0A915PMR6_9BILA